MKVNWKKILLATTNVALGIYLVLAVTAFNKPDESENTCTQVEVIINKTDVNGFLDANEISNILKQNDIYPLAQNINSIDIRNIEETLTANPLIKNVECYKTISHKVVIMVTQRMPVVRVKTEKGDDYYIDNEGNVMPRTKYTTNLMIATGNINRNFACKKLVPLVNTIINNRFWHNQIVQFNVLDDGSIELIPRVGEHVICIGEPVNVNEKLKRIEKFYKYGLNEAGWNKYSYINVEFDNQIICTKKKNKKKYNV